MRDLNATLIQCELAWEQPEDNRRQIGDVIAGLEHRSDLIVLPEMFTTGFSMNAIGNAEQPCGATQQWLQQLAVAYDCAITGSIAVHGDGGVYNRMLFATPDEVHHYDKRHLFRMGREDEYFTPGESREIFNLGPFRFLPQICYDLRFPVFSRNRGDYDVLYYVANWPAPRQLVWES